MEYIDIKSISELHTFYGYAKPLNPLISIIDLTKVDRSKRTKRPVFYRVGLYTIACKKITGQLKYGRTTYDFSEGSLLFTSPDQAVSPDPDIQIHDGWGLYIHPDFLNASERGRKLKDFSAFGYDANEALHVSDEEKKTLERCLQNIQRELSANIDNYSYEIILNNLELLFAYCTRFYGRQFLTRVSVNNDVVQRFERLLNDYFAQDTLADAGLPDVKYFASCLNLSGSYLSDLLGKYTGKTTLEHIHLKLIEKAKSLLWGTEKQISEIAYDLGFEHPSHFTKLFKSRAGMSPREFRNLN